MKMKFFTVALIAAGLVLSGCGSNAPGTNHNVSVSGVSLDINQLVIYCDDDNNTHQFRATVSPSNATNKQVSWYLSNAYVGSITDSGLFTASNPGSAVVSVTTVDGHYTDYCSITVKERNKTLDYISLSGTYKTNFLNTEQYQHDGLIVTAFFTNGEHETVDDFVVNEPDMSQLGQQQVVVSYTYGGITKTDSYTITISEDPIRELTLSGNYITEYNVGETFSTDGLVVELWHNSGYHRTLDQSEYRVAQTPNMSTPGRKQIVIEYIADTDFTASYYINVISTSILLGITLSGSYPTTFYLGDAFSYEGLVVIANYSDGDVTLSSDQYIVTAPNMSTAGEKTVTVSFTDNGGTFYEEYQINVLERFDVPVTNTIWNLNIVMPFSSNEPFTTKGIVTNSYVDNYGNNNVYIQEEGSDGAAILLYRCSTLYPNNTYVLVSGNLNADTLKRFSGMPEIVCNAGGVTTSVLASASENPRSYVTKVTDDNFWYGSYSSSSDAFIYANNHGPVKSVINDVTITHIASTYGTATFADGAEVSLYFGAAANTTTIYNTLQTYYTNGHKLKIFGHLQAYQYNSTSRTQFLIRTLGDIIDVDGDTPPVGGTKTVTIGAVNDFHGAINENGSEMGIAKVATILKTIKDQPNSLTLSQGDDWQGSIYSNYNHGNLVNDAFAYAHLSARTVGNHDFDWGVSALAANTARSYAGYTTPVLAANVYDFNFSTKQTGSTQQSNIGAKTVTYTLENGLKVGIVGVIGVDQITSINSEFTQDITFIDHVPVIKQEAQNLKNSGCDLVILSCHAPQDQVTGNGLESYVDLALCGHSHANENTTENGLTYAQFGSYGQQVGLLTLTYDTDSGSVVNTTIDSITTNNFSSYCPSGVDSNLTSLVNTYNAQCNSEANKTVAYSVSGNFYSSSTLPNLMCKAMYETAVAEGHNNLLLSYCNKARASLYSGSWTYADLYEAFPFDNVVYIEEVKGSDITREVAAYNYVYINPSYGTDSISINSNAYYKIAVLDYLLFHTNTNRYYDYFKTFDGDAAVSLTNNYRVILRDWLVSNGYSTYNILSYSEFSGSSFDRSRLS